MPDTTDSHTFVRGVLMSLGEATRRISVYLPAVMLRRLKELVLVRERKVDDLLVDGAEMVLRESGHLSPYRDTS